MNTSEFDWVITKKRVQYGVLKPVLHVGSTINHSLMSKMIG